MIAGFSVLDQRSVKAKTQSKLENPVQTAFSDETSQVGNEAEKHTQAVFSCHCDCTGCTGYIMYRYRVSSLARVRYVGVARLILLQQNGPGI